MIARIDNFKTSLRDPYQLQVHIPIRIMDVLYAIKQKTGITISAMLHQVATNPHGYNIPNGLTRPHCFDEPVHRFPMHFNRDQKAMVFTRVKLAYYEFGPFIRYLLEQYIDILEDLLIELIQEKEASNLQYSRVRIVETKKRVEIFDRGHKYHVYTFQFWAYVPPELRGESYLSGRLGRYRDLDWYEHPEQVKLREKFKDELN